MTTTRSLSRLAPLALLPALLLAGCTTTDTTERTLAYLELVPGAVTLREGATRRLTAIGTYSDGSVLPLTAGVTYSAAETATATVAADGTVTGVAAGETTVVATASGRTATCAVRVTGATLQAIAISPGSASLQIGATQALAVIGSYDFGPTADVTSGAIFTTSNGNRVSVSAAGVVTAIATGTATITANYGGKVATAEITVLAPTLVSIAVTPAAVTLPEGGTRALTVTGTYSSGPGQDLTAAATYTTSDAGKATVSAAGVVTAVAPGDATITATVGGLTSTSVVTVTARALQTIAVTPSAFSLVTGATRALTVTGTYDIGPTADLTASATFTSSSEGTATVSAAGVVTGVSAGPATITATVSGKIATADVTVTAPVLQSIAVTPATVTLAPGGTAQLTVTATYDVGPTADVTAGATFTSGAEGVATVSASGLVSAVAAGPATITATFSGQTATAAVTVSAITTTGGRVFFGGYEPGVSFAPFGGSTNDLSIDATEPNNGRPSLKVVVPNGNYTGGALVASVPRDLRAYNAVTFWAKASTANALNVAGLGDNAATNPPPFSAEVLGFPLTATWTKYVVPLPDPAKLNGSNALFHFAEDGANYTIWFSDIQYETLPATEVGAPTGATLNWPGAQTLAQDGTFQIPYQPDTVTFATPALPTGGSLKNVSLAWYTISSSTPGVVSVSPNGLVTGLAAGSTTLTATMNGIALAGSLVVTVTGGAGGAPTTTLTPDVAVHPAANVVSLYNSAGVYTDQPVVNWNPNWGQATTFADVVIAGKTVKKYSGMNYQGWDFAGTPVDASTFTHLHIDIWTPNATKLGVAVINFASTPTEVIVPFNASSTPPITQGEWISLDIPLTAFTGMTFGAISQMKWVDNGDVPPGGDELGTFFIDNVYFWK